MRTKFFMRNDTVDIECGTFEEALELARNCKVQNPKNLVTVNKRVWNDERQIVKYETLAVRTDGTYNRLVEFARR